MVQLKKSVFCHLVNALAIAGLAVMLSCGSTQTLVDPVAGPEANWTNGSRSASDANEACMVCHTAPPEDTTMDWNDAPGDHDECDACHIGDHGSKPTPPESVCLNCHQEDWEEVHPSGATACLSCHLWPHVPLDIRLKPGIHKKHREKGVQCYSCHKMMGGIMPTREKCLACHQNPEKTEHSRGALCSICHKS